MATLALDHRHVKTLPTAEAIFSLRAQYPGMRLEAKCTYLGGTDVPTTWHVIWHRGQQIGSLYEPAPLGVLAVWDEKDLLDSTPGMG